LELDKRREIVSLLLNKGILLDRDKLNQINEITDLETFHTHLLNKFQDGTLPEFSQIFDEYKTSMQQKGIDIPSPPTINVIFSYKGEPKKREVQDFTAFFTSRYHIIKAILQNRKELQNLTSINRLNQKKEREQVAVIAIVTDKQLTKTGKIVITAEDPTGTIKAIISQGEALEMAKETSLDEIIGIVGTCSGNTIFTQAIVIPDVPLYKEMKKSPDEVYALFTGDFHFGSKHFLKEPFEKFISWIRGEQGNEAQMAVAKKIKYIFMAGDLVDGVGIYPNQDKDLDITDIYEQYNEFSDQLKRIPRDKKIIVCPGNHDAMRVAEPQPPLYKDFAEAVWNLPNVTVVSNPAYINFHASDNFPGFDALMYHGFSFPFYADTVESIRNKGGQKSPELIMQYLLQRRHLAPTHTSTLYLPDAQKDNLVIDRIPDFFVTGHIHRVSAANYRNVTLLNCSCWIGQTEYQEKVGLVPQPGRAILVNLQTRKIKILRFYDEGND